MTKEELIQIAVKASENAYSPYSNCKVGASIVTKDGRVFYGCNIENASYGLTNCAERTCLFKAYSEGVRKEDIVAMAEYCDVDHVFSPCGACRQVMSELMDVSCPVYIAYSKGTKYVETTVGDLLPMAFKPEDL